MKKLIAGLLCLTILSLSSNALAYANWNELHRYDDLDGMSSHSCYCITDVTLRGLMNGRGDNKFCPDDYVTRAEFAVIVWRIAGCPAPSAPAPFVDVEPGAWYADAVAWLYENHYIDYLGHINNLGTLFYWQGEDHFCPDDKLTELAMAAIFYNFAKSKGMNVNPGLIDIQSSSEEEWARDAQNWAISHAFWVLKLQDANPHGTVNYVYEEYASATRLDTAIFASRFCVQYMDVYEAEQITLESGPTVDADEASGEI